jgi:hydroxyacylglutathione hydrolase
MTISTVDPLCSMDSNIFLAVGDRTVLIDTGAGVVPGAVDRIRAMLAGRPLDMIILTHCHADHIGGLQAFVDAFSPEVLAGPDAKFIASGDDRVILGGEVLGRIMPPFPAVKEIGDGEVIDIGCHRLRVIHTPGHTSGSICLFDEVTGTLFSGDTVFVQSIGRTDFPTGDSRQLLLSLEMLSGLKVGDLHPGHGPSTVHGARSIEYGVLLMGGII